MKTWIAWALALICPTALADAYFAGNPYSPIPPGCVTTPWFQQLHYGDNTVVFWEGKVSLRGAEAPSGTAAAGMATANLWLMRIGCAEPGRSVLAAAFRVPAETSTARFVLPSFEAEIGASSLGLVALSEPNEWNLPDRLSRGQQELFGDFSDGWYDARWMTWIYILDAWTPEEPPQGFRYFPSAQEYNLPFTLVIGYPGTPPIRITVPATSDVLEPSTDLPLNGRLSGHWVTPGAADQGLILSFANRVPAAGSQDGDPAHAPLLLFLSWFTYSPDGTPLWLTGVAEFPQGSAQAVVPIEWVGDGRFMDDRNAERQLAGQVVLSARNCNAIDMEYELEPLGLGAGTRRLERLHSLEIAGYPCRDYTARQAAAFAPPSH